MKIISPNINIDGKPRVNIFLDPCDLGKVLLIPANLLLIIFSLIIADPGPPRPIIHTLIALVRYDGWLGLTRDLSLLLLDVELTQLVLLNDVLDFAKLVELDVVNICDVF